MLPWHQCFGERSHPSCSDALAGRWLPFMVDMRKPHIIQGALHHLPCKSRNATKSGQLAEYSLSGEWESSSQSREIGESPRFGVKLVEFASADTCVILDCPIRSLMIQHGLRAPRKIVHRATEASDGLGWAPTQRSVYHRHWIGSQVRLLSYWCDVTRCRSLGADMQMRMMP